MTARMLPDVRAIPRKASSLYNENEEYTVVTYLTYNMMLRYFRCLASSLKKKHYFYISHDRIARVHSVYIGILLKFLI